MKSRSLCGALILLLFASPISALLCGTCLVGDCLPTTEPVVANSSVDAGSSEPANEGSADLPPCHRAMAEAKVASAPPKPADDEKPPCHGTSEAETQDPAPSSSTAVSECCAAPDTDRESSATLVFSAAFEPLPVAELDPRIPPAVAAHDLDRERAEPPRLSPPPLYKLNSSFLI